ncbi:hypothetical protein KC644_03875 [Candidatus Berkelbacteria bacterium]|nr:hypothetical protein [Candidatus Berkelbacteria bacterium]
MVFARLVGFVLSLGAGFALIRYAEVLVRTFGHADWAEKYLGSGGSYTVWKIAGILVIIFGFLYGIGRFDLAPEPIDLGDQSSSSQITDPVIK